MKLNQKGVSLVELLAALALVSTIAVIAWTALTIGFKHTAVETGKTRLQQEANFIITKLANEHRKNHSYSLIFEGNQLRIEKCSAAGACTIENVGSQYDYTGTVINGTPIDSHDSTPIDQINGLEPKKKHTMVVLKIADLNNEKNTVTVNTTLTRIITGSN